MYPIGSSIWLLSLYDATVLFCPPLGEYTISWNNSVFNISNFILEKTVFMYLVYPNSVTLRFILWFKNLTFIINTLYIKFLYIKLKIKLSKLNNLKSRLSLTYWSAICIDGLIFSSSVDWHLYWLNNKYSQRITYLESQQIDKYKLCLYLNHLWGKDDKFYRLTFKSLI